MDDPFGMRARERITDIEGEVDGIRDAEAAYGTLLTHDCRE
jgi:hypothetical protein